MTTCPLCGHKPKTIPLTPRQLATLECIISYINEHGVPPSFEDIRVGIGAGSKAMVSNFLITLDRKGWIKKHKYENRGIEVLRYPNGAT